MRIIVTASALCMTIVGLSMADDVHASMKQSTNIPAQPLAPALQSLAKDRDFQIVYVSEEIGDRRTAGALGEYTPEEALKKLLSGTGLTYKYLDDKTVTILPLNSKTQRQARRESGNSGAQGADPSKGEGKDTSSSFRLAQEAQGASTGPFPIDKGSDQQASQRKPVELQEVIVTAEKQPERLQRVPASIGVLTATALNAQHVADIQDVVNRVPGLSSDFAGAPGASDLTVRGISPGGGTETTTGLYIDDVSISGGFGYFIGAYEPAFFDLERIEVLRGPQGTLYGVDSFGGTIRYVNKQPELDEFSGEVKTDLYGQSHGDPGESVAGAVNLPLINQTLALRLSGIYEHDGGFIDHVDPAGAVVQKNSNTEEIAGVRGVLLWMPLDNVKVTPTLQYQQTKTGDRWTYDPNRGLYNSGRLLDEPLHDRFVFSELNVSADFGSSSLTAVSSYFDRRVNLTQDYTIYDNSGYVAPQVAGFYDQSDAKGSLEVLSAIATPAYRFETKQRWAQEIRLSSQFDHIGLRTLFGLYFDREVRGHSEQDVAAGFGAETQALFGVGTNQALTQAFSLSPGQADLGDTLFLSQSKERVTREAGFVEASWSPRLDPFQALTLTAGARYSRITYSDIGFADGFFNGGFAPIDQRFKENQVAPKYRISYQATDNVLVYASAAKGFRLGGTNQPLPPQCNFTAPESFSTDSIWSYEVGSKVGLLNRTVQLNTSAFHIAWSNIAEGIAPSCGFPFQANVGMATSNGGDISLEWRPLNGLNVQLGVAYTDAHFTKTIAADNVFKGSPVPFSPPWTANVSAEYTRPLGAGNGYVRTNYNFTDVSRGSLVVGQANFNRPAYDTLGASSGYRINGWDFSVYAKNLTNAHPPLEQDDHDGYTNVSTLRPRQIGVEAAHSF